MLQIDVGNLGDQIEIGGFIDKKIAVLCSDALWNFNCPPFLQQLIDETSEFKGAASFWRMIESIDNCQECVRHTDHVSHVLVCNLLLLGRPHVSNVHMKQGAPKGRPMSRLLLSTLDETIHQALLLGRLQWHLMLRTIRCHKSWLSLSDNVIPAP